VIETQAHARGISVAEARADLTSGSPLRRLTTPDEVAATAVFLASPAASAITGEDLTVSATSAWVS
jgi:NAD(P)-dependent dehydrogenase (short-subunit alcohol dehydrogenase family)